MTLNNSGGSYLLNCAGRCRVVHPNKGEQQKEWLKSYEVRKMLGISPGTLQSLRRTGTLRFSKVGGLMFYRYEDVVKMMEGNR